MLSSIAGYCIPACPHGYSGKSGEGCVEGCGEAEGVGWTGHSGAARQCNSPGRPSSFWAVWSCQVGVWGQSQLSQSPHSPPRVLLERHGSRSGCIVPWCSLRPMKGQQSGLCAAPLPPGSTVTQVVLSPAFPHPNSSIKGEPGPGFQGSSYPSFLGTRSKPLPFCTPESLQVISSGLAPCTKKKP